MVAVDFADLVGIGKSGTVHANRIDNDVRIMESGSSG